MKKTKKYEIDTFEKLCNIVNDENVNNLAVDLASWLLYYNNTMSLVRKKHPELKDKLNTEIGKASFIWIDDGKHDIVSTIVKNPATGEQTEYKAKRKK